MKQIVYTEQALNAWMNARPRGIVLPFDRLDEVAETLNVPLPQEEVIATFKYFCLDNAEGIPFLDFWKAYSHMCRLQEEVEPSVDSGLEGDIHDFLFLELETFRDSLLRYAAQEHADFPLLHLYSEIEKTKKMSEGPDFWAQSKEAMKYLELQKENEGKKLEEITVTMEEVTMMLITWLLEAISYQRSKTARDEKAAEKRAEREEEERELEREEQINRRSPNQLAVYVHVYDVSQESSIRKLNRVTANKFSPLKFGGVFHAGVEVAGMEWSYGASQIESLPGIVCHEIKTHPQHRYRQTVFMGHTDMTSEEVADLISEMVEKYPGWDYDLLRRNCCHFVDDICQRMGVGRIPGWIYRFARVGAGVETVISALKSLRGGASSDETHLTAA